MLPRIAIIDNNTLATVGLKTILQSVMPQMEADSYGSFAELESNHPERYVHYFVSMDIMLQHRNFFSERRNKTIVTTLSLDSKLQIKEFHSLCVNVPEPQLIKDILTLEQHAHGRGQNLPETQRPSFQPVLSVREIEVMSLIVEGCINKEIAERLGISLTTVITHRKNVMEKLGIRSVSALTIYAVTHGYVDINRI